MIAQRLSTEEFWSAMCRPEFVRLSLHSGTVGSGTLYCETPPELVPGFIEGVMAKITANLRPPETWWARFLGRVLGTG